MKKFTILLPLAALILLTNCKQEKERPTEHEDRSEFTFTVQEATEDFKSLPSLHSFAYAKASTGEWLMLGGRTNGFHGFGDEENFPVKKANNHIYVYDPSSDILDSMNVADLPGIPDVVHLQFLSTNMEFRQVDKYLYIAGGYGVANINDTNNTNWMTHNIFTRLNVDDVVQIVLNKRKNHLPEIPLFKTYANYCTSELVRATGGELFLMPDGNFYLVVGHNFTGKYSSYSAVQKYLNRVNVFKVEDKATGKNPKIEIVPVSTITDGLHDSVTQFRRRDLVVASNVGKGGNDYGISIYGGVFTYTAGCPSCDAGTPFRHPIYISGATSYMVDSSFLQRSNIYSAPHLQMYDAGNDVMYTTIFGGLGDTATYTTNNADFTTQIVTLKKDNNDQKTSDIYNSSGMPHYVGSEGVFIPAANAPMYNDAQNHLDIFDFNSLTNAINEKDGSDANGYLIGYIYGGIFSNSTEWDPSKNPTTASNKVYKVYMKKNIQDNKEK